MKSRAQIDAILKSAADTRRVAGVVAIAADHNGVIYEGAFGRRALPDGAPMTLDTVFWIASMTKAITAVAAMQLVEESKLALDRPAGEVIPQLGKTQVIDHFDSAGEPVLRAPKRPITLRNLLTHTSGFSEDVWHADMKRYVDKTGHPTGFSGKLAALHAPLIVDPDTRWEYGMSMDWVGQLIEKASGKTIDVYFRDHIFAPLGMRDSGYVINDEQKSRLAGVHVRKPDGSLEPFERSLPAKREYYPGGGSLYSTAGDYLTFLRMLLNGGSFGGKTVLRPETLKVMAQNHIGDIEVGEIRPARLELSNNVEFFPGIPKRWGLSFLINTRDTPAGRSAGSLAWAGLGNTYYWLDPKKRIAGVLLTQVLPFADPTVLALLDDFETAIYAKN
jgi:methyl acetate hydrolase